MVTRAAVGTNRYLNCRTGPESATALPDTREAQLVRGRLRTSRHAAASTVRLRRTAAIPPAPLPVVRHQKRPADPIVEPELRPFNVVGWSAMARRKGLNP